MDVKKFESKCEKKDWLAASGIYLKTVMHYPKQTINYLNLHKIIKRATSKIKCNFKLALQLHKTHNEKIANKEWIQLNLNQYFTYRYPTQFMSNSNFIHIVGENALSNRLCDLNGHVNYKIECKILYLTQLLWFGNNELLFWNGYLKQKNQSVPENILQLVPVNPQ
jgi:hypothetical protein